jgi:hypothetical protein
MLDSAVLTVVSMAVFMVVTAIMAAPAITGKRKTSTQDECLVFFLM